MSDFFLGVITATEASMHALAEHYILPEDLLERHASGDWGDVRAEDRERNNLALENGGRLWSSYEIDNKLKIYIITDAADPDGVRDCTNILLPSEY